MSFDQMLELYSIISNIPYEILKKIPKELLFALVVISEIGLFRIISKMKIRGFLLIFLLVFLSYTFLLHIPLGSLITLIYALWDFSFFLFKKSVKQKQEAAVLPAYTLRFPIKNKDFVDIENPFRGIYIQGGAGSGKSATFIKPMIKQFAQQGITGLMYDFKSPELSDVAYSYYKNNTDVKFAFVDFRDIHKSERINPISPRYLTKYSYAFEFSKAIVYNLMPENIKKQDYWSKSCVTVVAGIMWFFKKHHPECCTIPHIVSFVLNCNAERLVEIISGDVETAGMVSSLKEALDQNAGKQIAGVLGTLKNSIAQLNIPEIYYILSEDSVNLDLNSPENPTFLAVGNDSTLSDTYAPVISLIITVCTKLMNQPNKCNSSLLLDEAPTLYIPNLEQIPATGRSNKIITVYAAQDFTQIVDKYGNEKAESLISNLGNQLYGRTTNAKTAKRISEIFDKKDMYYTSYNTGSSKSGLTNSSNRGESRSVQQRDVVNIREIISAKPGRFFGVIAEGRYKNILGVTFDLFKPDIEPIPIKKECIGMDEIFKKINLEINDVINDRGSNSKKDFNKEKIKDLVQSENVDITNYINRTDS